MMDCNFDRNIQGYDRPGTGTMHVRSKTDGQLENIKEALGVLGIKNVQVSEKYKPVWKLR